MRGHVSLNVAVVINYRRAFNEHADLAFFFLLLRNDN